MMNLRESLRAAWKNCGIGLTYEQWLQKQVELLLLDDCPRLVTRWEMREDLTYEAAVGRLMEVPEVLDIHCEPVRHNNQTRWYVTLTYRHLQLSLYPNTREVVAEGNAPFDALMNVLSAYELRFLDKKVSDDSV